MILCHPADQFWFANVALTIESVFSQSTNHVIRAQQPKMFKREMHNPHLPICLRWPHLESNEDHFLNTDHCDGPRSLHNCLDLQINSLVQTSSAVLRGNWRWPPALLQRDDKINGLETLYILHLESCVFSVRRRYKLMSLFDHDENQRTKQSIVILGWELMGQIWGIIQQGDSSNTKLCKTDEKIRASTG